MTTVGISKILSENPFGRNVGEGITEAEALEICIIIVTQIQIPVMQIEISL